MGQPRERSASERPIVACGCHGADMLDRCMASQCAELSSFHGIVRERCVLCDSRHKLRRTTSAEVHFSFSLTYTPANMKNNQRTLSIAFFLFCATTMAQVVDDGAGNHRLAGGIGMPNSFTIGDSYLMSPQGHSQRTLRSDAVPLPRLQERKSALSDAFSGDPDRIRTCNQQNRNLPFYPVELRGRFAAAKIAGRSQGQEAGPGAMSGLAPAPASCA